MSRRRDLTRWNRAGLNRFEYVDGNAVEYLETLRQQLATVYADPTSGRVEWLSPPEAVPPKEEELATESLIDRQLRFSRRQQRILESYHQGRRDWAWEISRSVARACHVLSGHIDAYANEGYLGTATQWDSVRRLVELLDYYPAPPASATTSLVFTASGETPGTLPKGFQVKYSPPEGGPKVIFETLEDLALDPALDALRPMNWDKSQIPAASGTTPAGDTGTQTVDTWWYAQRKPKVSAGDIAMVYRDEPEAGEAVTIASVADDSSRISLESSTLQESWFDWTISKTILKVSPRWRRKAWLNGQRVIRTRLPHGLTKGAYVGWKQGGQWQYAEVEQADRLNLWLDFEGELPGENEQLFQLRPLAGDIVPEGYEVVVVLAGPEGQDLAEITVEPDAPPEPEIPDFSNVFDLAESLASGGGGAISIPLMPPAGLPEIGSFLIPTPFLPIDLIKAAVKLLLKLGIMQIPSNGKPVFEGIPPAPEDLLDLVSALDSLQAPVKSGDEFTKINDEFVMGPAIIWKPQIPDDETIKAQKLHEALAVPGDAAVAALDRISQDISEMGPPLAVRGSDIPVAVVADGSPAYLFDGSPDKLEAGDWLVAEAESGLKALQVDAVQTHVAEENNPYFSIRFGGISGDEGGIRQVYGDFRGALAARDATINLTTISGAEIELESGVPPALGIGDTLMLTAEGQDPLLATVVDVEGDRITVDPPATGFTVGHLLIRGNVVRASHGETRPAKILGSGDAGKTSQSFVLEVDGITFTPDASMSSGVAAAIDVDVAGRIWEQVSTLNDSAPGDAHYAVRMTEAGHVRILFGDGERGRRLPTGRNNVRVSYRVGTGLTGNVPARGLEKAVKPSRLVAAVLQPLPAAGGGGMEDTSSLRENAPATLLALKRAVSLGDFSNLAMSRSNVWHARSRRLLHHDGRMELVNVVILPAGGAYSADIEDDVRNFLQAHALPGVQVSINSFEGVRFDLAVTVRVDTNAFVAQEVRQAVIAALREHFKLQRRKLGEPLYLSEVVKVVEAVQGVENSICVIPGSDDPRVVPAGGEHRVLYLEMDDVVVARRSKLLVRAEAYQS